MKHLKKVKKTPNKLHPSLVIVFFLILLLFIIFIARAFLSDKSFWDKGSHNPGYQILPPASLNVISLIQNNGIPVPSSNLENHWGLIYITPQTCTQECVDNIYKMLRLKDLFQSSSHSIYLILLTTKQDAKNNPILMLLREYYPSVYYAVATPEELQKLFNTLPKGTQSLDYSLLYLLDPQMNLIRSYPPNVAPGLLKLDLSKKINLSN